MKETLKYLRMQNNFSQNKIADYIGISRQMYIKYESGETEPTIKCVRELSKLYKVTYDILIDNKYKDDYYKTYEQSDAIYNIQPTDSLIVESPAPSYSASNSNANSKIFREVWLSIFKLNTDELIKIASRALRLVEEKKRLPEVKDPEQTPEMSQEEKMRLFNKFNGCIKDVKIEDWKSEKMKYLEEKYGL